ncbi:hypothetical protein DFH07DRAFT_959567 [Mycena maculata]|uniref:Uncharacterized protein n=1 Tax=Mycena maculata TaxID=230809 RepID=A0AAD7NCW7_9AGAR|nr:hypothetical protein DFH07DRAFT_959567 [Mycena maculata]
MKWILIVSIHVQTEIPDLQSHLLATGERRRLTWATDFLKEASIFQEKVHYYFAGGMHPGRLPLESREKALNILTNLRTANITETSDALDSIDDEFKFIIEVLAKSVAMASKDSPRVMKKFPQNMHWNTYKSCMKSRGIHVTWDLNRGLTRNIISEIQSSWNSAVNGSISLVLEEAFKAVSEIVEVLNTRAALEDLIVKVCQSLGIEFVLQKMRQDWIELYQAAFREFGKGTFQHMKDSNQAHIEEYADIMFNTITVHIRNPEWPSTRTWTS